MIYSSKFKTTYSQKPFDHEKQSATDAFKTALKKEIQKPAEASGDLIGNFAAKLQKYQEIQQRIV